MNHYALIAMLLTSFTAASSIGQETIVDFEDVGASLESDSAYRGEDTAGGFRSGPIDFVTRYNPAFDSWNGSAYSNRTSWTLGGTSGFEEFQFGNDTVVADDVGSGSGADGSDTWGVLFGFTPNEARFEVDPDFRLKSLQINNTRTTAHILENGNSSATAFGPDDRFEVIFNSIRVDIVDDMEEVTVLGSTGPFLLADGTSIVRDWIEIDFEGTAIENANMIGVEFRSTDTGMFGINTPTYVAIDNLTLTAIPEPSSIALVMLSGFGFSVSRRRKR